MSPSGTATILRPAVVAMRPNASRADVSERRRASRLALTAGSRRAGMPDDCRWRRATDRPPQATGPDGSAAAWHASLTNTRRLAAAVVVPAHLGPVGLDAEWLGRKRLAAARARLSETGELQRLGRDDASGILTLWTAKEAVMKRAGIGIAAFERVRLQGRDGQALHFTHANALVWVYHFRLLDHVFALATGRLEGLELAPWIVVEERE